MNSRTDFLGNTVVPGDKIFYSSTGRYNESRYGIVTRITDAGTLFMRIEKGSRNSFGTVGTEVKVSNTFIKVFTPE